MSQHHFESQSKSLSSWTLNKERENFNSYINQRRQNI